jgi:hypothetical protein
MGRRIDIKPDNVGQLGGKARVARALESAQSVRLQFVRPPDAPDTRTQLTPGLVAFRTWEIP